MATRGSVHDRHAKRRVRERNPAANESSAAEKSRRDRLLPGETRRQVLPRGGSLPTGARERAESRVAELKADAVDDGIAISPESEQDLWSFLDSAGAIRRPYIGLLDNGNFRAVWRNAEGEQIGLQFRGGNEVQYVLFARRPPSHFIARSAGRDVLANMGPWIDVHGLRRLLAA